MNNLTDEELTNLVNQKIKKSLLFEANDNVEAIPDNTVINPFAGEVVESDFLDASDFSSKYDEFENSLMNAINYNFVNKPIKYNEIITNYNGLSNYIKVSLKYDRLSNMKKNIIDYKMSELIDNIAIVRNISEVSDYATIYSNYLQEMIDNINNKTYQRINVKFGETSKKELQNLIKLDETLFKTFKSYDRNKTPIKKRKLAELFNKYLMIYNKLKPILTSADKDKLIVRDKTLLNDIQLATETFITPSFVIGEDATVVDYEKTIGVPEPSGGVGEAKEGEVLYADIPYDNLKRFYDSKPEYKELYSSVMAQSNNLRNAFFNLPILAEKKATIDSLIKKFSPIKTSITKRVKDMPEGKKAQKKSKAAESKYKDDLIKLLDEQQKGYQNQIKIFEETEKTKADAIAKRERERARAEEERIKAEEEAYPPPIAPVAPEVVERDVEKERRIEELKNVISALSKVLRDNEDFPTLTEEQLTNYEQELQNYIEQLRLLESEGKGRRKVKKQTKTKKAIKKTKLIKGIQQPKGGKQAKRQNLMMKILKRLNK